MYKFHEERWRKIKKKSREIGEPSTSEMKETEERGERQREKKTSQIAAERRCGR